MKYIKVVVYSQGQTQFQQRDIQAKEEEEEEESMEGKGSLGPRLLQQLQDGKAFCYPAAMVARLCLIFLLPALSG